MRYVLQRKSDSKYYRGREYRGEKGWTEDINTAYLFQNQLTPRSGYLSPYKPTVTCNCPMDTRDRWRQRHRKSGCAVRTWAEKRFDEQYMILPLRLNNV